MIAFAFGVAATALYLRGVALYRKRYPERRFSSARIAAFIAGTAALIIVLLPRFDTAADSSFAAHMIQHMVMWLVAPPLILLGAPLLLLVAVPKAQNARRVTAFANSRFGHALFSPLTGWLAYVAVLWGAHFSGLYEAALEHPPLHVLEHALFLLVAFLFWSTIVQTGYAPRPIPFAVRAFLLFFTIPQGAFLGFALNAAGHVLYAHYAAHFTTMGAALADQRAGADVMWILGGFILFAAFMCTAGSWAAAERGAAVVA